MYWGAAYGVKAFLNKQPGWEICAAEKPENQDIIERIVFKNTMLKVIVAADAYRGAAIKSAVEHFLWYASGSKHEAISAAGEKLVAGGNAELAVYVGHNGLMDFDLPNFPRAADAAQRRAAVFACQSRYYFKKPLHDAGALPLVWTRGNMAPEAYTLHALVESWAKGSSDDAVRALFAF